MAVLGATSRSCAVAVAAALALAWDPAALAQTHAPEYAVKAAYLYRFAPFVAWPASAFASPTSPFYLCVQGDDPFDGSLDQAVNGQRLDGRQVVVRRVPTVDGMTGCHIVFLAGSRRQSASDAVKTVRGEPVLTVADEGRGSAGSVIQFVVKDSRVRFQIDVEAAQANRVNISSKLLSLALPVRSGG